MPAMIAAVVSMTLNRRGLCSMRSMSASGMAVSPHELEPGGVPEGDEHGPGVRLSGRGYRLPGAAAVEAHGPQEKSQQQKLHRLENRSERPSRFPHRVLRSYPVERLPIYISGRSPEEGKLVDEPIDYALGRI